MNLPAGQEIIEMLKAIFGRSGVIDTTRASSYPCEGTKTRMSFAVAYAPALGGGCGGGGGDDIGACLTRSGGGGGIITAEFRFNGECAREGAEDNAGVVRGGGEK